MKKNYKYLFMLVLGIILIPFLNVNAQTYKDSIIERDEWVVGDYIKKIKGNHIFFQQMTILKRASDRQYVYCIQPGTPIVDGVVYNGYDSDYAVISKMSEEQWNRVSLLAYYGYGYKDENVDHTAKKWYVITQFMIWHSVPTDYEQIYFTDKLNGNKIIKYTAEMAEMEELLSKHYKVPNFNNIQTEMTIGSQTTITDTNGVLGKFNIQSVDKLKVQKNGNNLVIEAAEVGEGQITFSKTNNRFGRIAIVYVDDKSQNILFAGDIDPTRAKLNIKVVGGKVTINKLDKDNNEPKSQGEATLQGAVYGIYKEDGTKVGSITTNENGIVQSSYLPSLGRFYVQEEKASKGYLVDEEKYYFEITKEDLYPEINVFEKVIKRKFNFIKVYANDKTGIMIPEENVKFGIYNNKNELVKELVTDNQGNINFELPYGKYTVKQLTTTLDHEKVNDFEIEVKETGEVVSKVMANAEIKAKLRVVKIDKDTKEVIERKGIKFKIFSFKENDYVCQTTSYPQNKIRVYETNDKGEFITPYVLSSGRYKLEEVDQKIDGYLWNKESHEFYIGEDSKLRTDSEYGIIFDTYFENSRVKGKIEIIKNGETVELTDKGFIYSNNKLLKDVEYTLYAKEDILFNGKLIFKKGSKIVSKLTDNEGRIIFSDLYLGKYYLQETKTLDGYVLDAQKYDIELNYKDQYTDVVEYQTTKINYIPKGNLEFTKTDFSESKTLPDTKIEIYTDKDKLVFTGKTDSNGKIIIDELPVGKYYILEKEAPNGYKLNEEKMYFEIKENGEVVKSLMKDEILVEVPNTEANDNHIIEILGLGLLVLGIGSLIFVKKAK